MSKAETTARQLEKALAAELAAPPVDILVLLDGSGSVKSGQFEICRLIIRQLVDAFPTDPKDESARRMGLIQFDDDIKIESPLVSNKSTLNCSITGMTQMGGGTSAGSAFGQARFIFQADFRPVHHCVVFLTDGDCNDAISVASRMRDTENVHIIAIGVGNGVSAEAIAKIASNNAYFHFNTFEDLKDVFTHLNKTTLSPPSVDVIARGSRNCTLQVTLPPGVPKTDQWEASMFDFFTNQWKELGASQSDVLVLRTLNPNEKYRVRARVKLPSAAWTAWSENFEFRTLIETALSPIMRDPVKRKEAFEKNHKYLKDFQIEEELTEMGISHLNILMVGRIGAGKSSLLDSIISSIKGVYTPVSPVRDSLETVTQSLSIFPITKKGRQAIIRGYDIYGWTESNYQKEEFGYVLDGYVKADYRETAGGFLPSDTNPSYNRYPTYNDKVHSVLVVVSISTVGSKAEMEVLGKFYGTLTTRGYQPIFVLTKVDRLKDEVLIGHPENLYDSGVVDAAIESFCTYSKVPRDNVLPVINYTGPFESENPNYVVQLLVTNVLKAAVQNAVTYLAKSEHLITKQYDELPASEKKKLKQKGKQKEESEEEEEEEDSDDNKKKKGKAKEKKKSTPTKGKKAKSEEEEEEEEEHEEEDSDNDRKKKGKDKKATAKKATTKKGKKDEEEEEEEEEEEDEDSDNDRKKKGKDKKGTPKKGKKEEEEESDDGKKKKGLPKKGKKEKEEEDSDDGKKKKATPKKGKKEEDEDSDDGLKKKGTPKKATPTKAKKEDAGSDDDDKKKKSTPKKTPSKLDVEKDGATPSPPGSPSMSDVMGLVDAAKYLDVSTTELESLLESKQLKGRKIGSNWKISKSAIEAYLNE